MNEFLIFAAWNPQNPHIVWLVFSNPGVESSMSLPLQPGHGKLRWGSGRSYLMLGMDGGDMLMNVDDDDHLEKDPWCCYIWCAMDPINIPPLC